ncbi:hypothetical protein ACH4OY_30380 [Micromonospora rubida]|uniref:Uncharacterized protein n=1 Tax=Micromonospora rubida TaxID=2697657 RepID=A0ABW7SY40_9ACTN
MRVTRPLVATAAVYAAVALTVSAGTVVTVALLVDLVADDLDPGTRTAVVVVSVCVAVGVAGWFVPAALSPILHRLLNGKQPSPRRRIE